MNVEKENPTERRKNKRIQGLYSGKYAYQEEPDCLYICRGPSVEELKEIARKYEERTDEPWGPLLGAADF